MKEKQNFWTGSLHLGALFSLVAVRPLLSFLGNDPSFFTTRHLGAIDVALFPLVLSTAIPALLILVEAILWRSHAKGYQYTHLTFIGGLACLYVLQILKYIRILTLLPSLWTIVIAVLAGALTAYLYWRGRPLRVLATTLIPCLLLYPALFLMHSPVANALLRKEPPKIQLPRVDASAPVVMVIFDELSLGALLNEKSEIDAVRYPHFAALAHDSYWFRNATASSDATDPAVPAMLTAMHPKKFYGQPLNEPVLSHNLFALLGGTYNLDVSETIFRLCPEGLCHDPFAHRDWNERAMSLLRGSGLTYLHLVLPTSLELDIEPADQGWRLVAQPEESDPQDQINEKLDDRPAGFRKFVASIQNDKRPTLFFAHSMLPHAPRLYLPSGKKYNSRGELRLYMDGLTNDQWSNDEWPSLQAWQRYLLQVGFVDKLLGELIERLKKEKLYDRSLIIVTSDYGASFRPGQNYRSIDKANFQDIMPIPLFVKKPHQKEGIVSARNVEGIDIMPTLADALGIRIPWSIDGQSALNTSLPERAEKTVFNAESKQDVVFGPKLEEILEPPKRKLAFFGSGKSEGLYAIGPYAQLIGRRVSDLGKIGPPSIDVEILPPWLYDNVDLNAPILPCRLRALLRFSRPLTGPVKLAVAVNGTIAAVTRTFGQESDGYKISAMLPETALKKGKNSLQILVVWGPRDHPLFQSVRQHPSPNYELLGAPGREDSILMSPGNDSFRIMPGAVAGWMDRSLINYDRVEFSGWAADIERRKIPDMILVFADGKFLYSGGLNSPRPDISRVYGPAVEMSGYSFGFQKSDFKDLPHAEIRFFGVLKKEGVASELYYHKGYRWRPGRYHLSASPAG